MGQVFVGELGTTQVKESVGVPELLSGVVLSSSLAALLFSSYKLEERVPVHVQPCAASGLLLDLRQPDGALLYFGKRSV